MSSAIFDIKEHFAAIGLALLPAYWVCWRRPYADELAQTRTALTSILAFIVWWSFLTGHVANNIMGFGSMTASASFRRFAFAFGTTFAVFYVVALAKDLALFTVFPSLGIFTPGHASFARRC